ncbi:hypothetical protein FRC17_010044 [Serendipita sp. 399]|nr:hypothetical protein FRC17_010044 [Serendipita sp. 399]
MDGPVTSKGTQWVTAERLLQNDQDSDEEDILQDAIVSAGTSHLGDSFSPPPPRESVRFAHEELPTSLSSLSIIPAGRRLVKSTRMKKGMSRWAPKQKRERDRLLSTVDESSGTRMEETNPPMVPLTHVYHHSHHPHPLDNRLSPSQAAAFDRIAEILQSRWSQRNLPNSAALSPTSFGASLSSYGDDDDDDDRRVDVHARDTAPTADQKGLTLQFSNSMAESIEQRLSMVSSARNHHESRD